jgi:hypothetical protein
LTPGVDSSNLSTASIFSLTGVNMSAFKGSQDHRHRYTSDNTDLFRDSMREVLKAGVDSQTLFTLITSTMTKVNSVKGLTWGEVKRIITELELE